ncbi:hypothetical protein YC2023_101602 [Brassica napus]
MTKNNTFVARLAKNLGGQLSCSRVRRQAVANCPSCHPHGYGPMLSDPFEYPERESICGLHIPLGISLGPGLRYPQLLGDYLVLMHRKKWYKSLLSLNEEGTFENVHLVVVKMNNGNMKVVNMKFSLKILHSLRILTRFNGVKDWVRAISGARRAGAAVRNIRTTSGDTRGLVRTEENKMARWMRRVALGNRQSSTPSIELVISMLHYVGYSSLIKKKCCIYFDEKDHAPAQERVDKTRQTQKIFIKTPRRHLKVGVWDPAR